MVREPCLILLLLLLGVILGISPPCASSLPGQWAAGWEASGLEKGGRNPAVIHESREIISLRSKTERKGQGWTTTPKNKLSKILPYLLGL